MAPKAAAAAKPAVKRPAEGADNPPAKKGGVGLGQGRKKSNGLGKATGGTSEDAGRARGCERAGPREDARAPQVDASCEREDA